MTEIILLLVIVALCGLIGFMDWNNRKERKSLVNALMSKTNDDLVNLELADKTKIEPAPQESKEDLVEVDDLDDKEYDRFVLNKNE